jgi:predicted Fe-Mo cluster-binding NifX family protein
MKIAITSTGPSTDAKVSEKFGRCSFFIIVDNDTNAVSSIANPAEHAEHGAGPDAAQLMIREHIDMVLTGAVGTNAEVVLQKGGVQFTTGLNGAMTVREAISTFLKPKSN